MRTQLLHLSGPLRGQTITYPKSRVLIGTDSDADVRYPQRQRVHKRHAEITFVEPECSFHLAALDGQVFVNGREVREIILEHNDLIEFGMNGPKARFRVHVPPGAYCKPVHLMLSDAREVRAVSGVFAWGRSLRGDLVRNSSRQLRIVLALALLGGAFAAAYFGGAIATRHTSTREGEFRRMQFEAFDARLTALRQQLHLQMADFRRQQAGHATREELNALGLDLARRAEIVDAFAARSDALRRVMDEYSKAVCLIHGVYTFHPPPPVIDPSAPPQDPATNAAAPLPEETIELEYIGSGFLASADGWVVTNRHVAEPWWNNEIVAPAIEQGYTPAFVRLEACFPGKELVEIDPQSIRLSQDGVDVAVMKVPIADVPVLPLFEGDLQTLRGGRVVLLGYPTGLNGILARLESDAVEETMNAATNTSSLLSELARRGAIMPVITQGALNEIRERRLVYDAETTSGGSGGPAFGPDGTVIGVNFAITRDFDGTNFGVPVNFVARLLSTAKATESPVPHDPPPFQGADSD